MWQTLFVLMSLQGPAALAESPSITSVMPPGGARGTSTVLTIQGTGLARAALFVSGSGITLGKPQYTNAGLRVRLTAAASAAVGPRELLAVTREGASLPVSIWIGVFEQRDEVEPNDSPGQRVDAPLPVSLYGRIDRPGDRDVFLFEAKAGETWTVDCLARSFGSPLDLLVEVKNPEGEVIPVPVASFAAEHRVTFSIKSEGLHAVTIRASEREGGPDHWYLCSIGRMPVIQEFTPRGERAGRVVGLTVRGVNLGTTTRARIAVPSDAEGYSWQTVPTAIGPSLPFRFPVADVPTVAITESDQTMAVPIIPGALEGKFEAYEVARFSLDASAASNLAFRLYSDDIGSPARARFSVLSSDGRAVTGEGAPGQDGTRGTLISRQGGQYVVEIRHAGGGRGPNAFYRLQIEKEVPGFRVTAGRRWLILSAGGSVRLPIHVVRVGGFAGPVELSAVNLPAGIKLENKRVGAGQESTELILSASSSARRGPFLLRLSARARVVGRLETHGVRVVHPEVRGGAYREIKTVTATLLPVMILPPVKKPIPRP